MTPTPTRVIWMTSDHMRHDHIATHGHPGMFTPALDRLVNHGIGFDQCYTQNPMCMPSRCSFMTGLYPTQTGVTTNGHQLPPNFSPTVATTFGAAGYATAQIGKLHFQPHEDLDFDPKPRDRYGFDVFWLSEERGNYSDAYYHWLEGKYPQHAAAFRVPRSSDPLRQGTEKTPRPIDAPWQASQAGWIVDAASRYLSTRRDTRQFMHLGFYNPHPPLTPVREAWDLTEGRTLNPRVYREHEWDDKLQPLKQLLHNRVDWTEEDFAGYRRGLAAMVTEMDLAIGWLVDWLKQNDMLDDTLLVFSSDHGDYAGDHNLTHKTHAFYASVMRVPVVMHWPGGLGTGGRRCGQLIEKLDVLPTLLGLCGAYIPPVMAGRDYSAALLAGREIQGRDDVFAYHDQGTAMLRTPRFNYVRYEPAGSEVLFDLAADPDELRNVAADPGYHDALQDCRLRLLKRALAAGTSAQRRVHPY